MAVQVPEHGSCLVCGAQNPKGFGLRWFWEDGRITSRFTFTEAQQGPPGYAHGGALAAVLDEAMGAAVWASGHRVVAGEIRIQYLKPVPLGQEMHVTAWVRGKEGKKVFAQGEITFPDGTVATRAEGIFVEAPHLFSDETVRMWYRPYPDAESQA